MTKHGLSHTKLYKVWLTMKQRCNNPNCRGYKWYGKKGISICTAWENDFKAFYEWSILNGYKDGLTIDRIDPNKNYSPDNCRFITMSAQQRNRSSCKYISYKGETMSVQEWAEKLNITPSTLRSRFNKGWSIKRALTEPVGTVHY